MADDASSGETKPETKRDSPRGVQLPSWLKYTTVLKIAARIPNWLWRPLARLASRIAVWRGYKPIRQWQMNAAVMLGRSPTKRESYLGIMSWFENLIGSVQLAKYSPADNIRRVEVSDEGFNLLHDAWADGGVVVALPHMGDWDLAGAWACAKGMPVSSVAERLADDEFAYFMGVRSKVGMTIYSHKDHHSFEKLTHDVQNGHVVALVSDRDLSRHGIPVTWKTKSGPKQVTMPPGPVRLAQITGASLLAAICTFIDGYKMRIDFYGPIPVSPGEEGLRETTQRLADIFSDAVGHKVIDWHLMQRFFPGHYA
jgi:KDO2-lipid IV(A) lauroyltransferase